MVGFRGDQILEKITTLSCISLCSSAILSSLTLFQMLVNQMVDAFIDTPIWVGEYIVPLFSYLTFASLLIVIQEPEKLKFLAMPVIFVLLTLAFTYSGESVYQIFENGIEEDKITFFDFKNCGTFLGISSYAFSSMSIMFNSKTHQINP